MRAAEAAQETQEAEGKEATSDYQGAADRPAVRTMASSLASAKLHVAKTVLKDEASIFKTMDIFQAVLFAGGTVFLFKGAVGLVVSVLAIGTFAPMLIRRGIAKWRDSLIP